MFEWMGRGIMVALLMLECGAGSAVWAVDDKQTEEKNEPVAQKITLAELPAPVRATINKEMPSAEIKLIEKEEEHGKVVYDVEAKVKGQDVEMDISSDGKVLTREERVPFASLPTAVRLAAKDYFGGTENLVASREFEEGKTFYEVEGTKGNQKAAVKFTGDGKQAGKD